MREDVLGRGSYRERVGGGGGGWVDRDARAVEGLEELAVEREEVEGWERHVCEGIFDQITGLCNCRYRVKEFSEKSGAEYVDLI